MLTTGCSLIHLAAMRRSPEQIARALKEYGEDPNAQDSLGRTPLHCLLANVRGEPQEERQLRLRACVRLLLDAGADVERINVFGRSPKADLHRLARAGWHLGDNSSESARVRARRPYFDCALIEASFRGRARTVRRLIERRVKPNLEAAWHALILGWCGGVWTDLYADGWSAKSALREIVFDLLDAGLQVEMPTEDDEVAAVVTEWQQARRVYA